MPNIVLTNLLGSILVDANVPALIQTGTNVVTLNCSGKPNIVVPSIVPNVYYKYEAQLAQCAYLSRLIYTPSEIFLRGR